MPATTVVVHLPLRTGSRRVTVHSRGRDEILGVYNAHDLVVLLEVAGVDDPEGLLNAPR
ncbi:hypothetical protein AB0O86_30050 [Streptomyces hirsutus]|uniref:hypothetical protein n=1 Tax=Streptomyces hirsutus TaxID=35620 RepID=UPI0034499E99